VRLDAGEARQQAEQRQAGEHQQRHLGDAAEELAQEDVASVQSGEQEVLQGAAPLLVGDGAGDEGGGGQQQEDHLLVEEQEGEAAADDLGGELGVKLTPALLWRTASSIE